MKKRWKQGIAILVCLLLFFSSTTMAAAQEIPGDVTEEVAVSTDNQGQAQAILNEGETKQTENKNDDERGQEEAKDTESTELLESDSVSDAPVTQGEAKKADGEVESTQQTPNIETAASEE